MKNLYDIEPIYTTEEYVGYGKDDLSTMTWDELMSELERTEKEIETAKSEFEEADSFPSYALKERLADAQWYKNKVIEAIDKFNNDKTKDDSSNTGINAMIRDLDRQLKKGTITQKYHDKYVQKLNDKRELYDENKKRQEVREKEEKENEFKKNHPFKHFKKKLEDYKRK